MSSDNIVIKVNSVSKCYPIYKNPRDRLKQFVIPYLQHLIGKKPQQFFEEFWALKDISFEVKKGETVGVIGRNGNGKSTLLQIICGTLSPTVGDIETFGRVAALLELGSGFNLEFTGRENVYLNATILGLTQKEVEQRFNNIVEFAGIHDFIDQPVKTYSSGMLMRLAFAVIAHVDADILIVDEALSVGDAFFTQKCMRFIRDFQEKGGTLLFVSHDTGAVINLCERAIWLNKGEIKLEGIPKDVTQVYLKELYELEQGGDIIDLDSKDDDLKKQSTGKLQEESLKDMRLDFINRTIHRNDIEIFHFNPDAENFGKGGGKIISAYLLDENNNPLSWVVGGERVKLKVECYAHIDMLSPIVGFIFNDRLGQALFGENTFNFLNASQIQIRAKEKFEAIFEFRMPILQMGDYTITLALADGTQQDHIQHHWIYEAVNIKSHSTSVSTGLVGVPMSNIRIIKK